MTHSAIYAGDLVHVRADVHARRQFRYPVYLAALDLAELPVLGRDVRLFSHGRRNAFALVDTDYTLDASPAPTRPAEARSTGSLRDRLHALLTARDLPLPASTQLVTNLRVLGYVFNPVSFFLNYDASGALLSVVAEVNNTYGGRLVYVLGPAQQIGERAGRIGYRTPRELFVSPFLHGEAHYEWWFPARRDPAALAITMHVDTAALPSARVFTAHLTGDRRPFTDATLARAALRYPLMSLQVIALIHYEALKLKLLGAPYRTPDDEHRPIIAPSHVVTGPRAVARPPK